MSKLLVVDLDGTFIKNDMLFESFVFSFFRNPLIFIKCFILLLSKDPIVNIKSFLSNFYLKKFANHALNIRSSVKKLIQSKKNLGYKVFLVSASHESIVKSVYEEFTDLFDGYYGSSSTNGNISGQHKLDFIKDHFNDCEFEYVGDSKKDIVIWNNSVHAYCVTSDKNILNKVTAEKTVVNEHLFKNKCDINNNITPPHLTQLLTYIVKQLRIHQWAKNSLIFLPAIAVHSLLPSQDYVNLIFSFLPFSLLASSVYIINDFIDLDDDRMHKTKCNRPLASCNLSIPQGFLLLILCLISSVILCLLVSKIFLLLCIAYFVGNLLYSLKLKKIVLFDCIILAMMYVYRIGLGVEVTSVPLSPWMMSFAFFIFLSLAFIKRYSELFNLNKRSQDGDDSSKENNEEKSKIDRSDNSVECDFIIYLLKFSDESSAPNNNKNLTSHNANEQGSKDTLIKTSRGYQLSDINLIMLFAVVSGFLSVLVCNLYYNSDEVKHTFKCVWLTYLSLPVLVYWQCRVYLKAHRGHMNEDPVMFAINDKVSILLGIMFVIFFSLGAVVPW